MDKYKVLMGTIPGTTITMPTVIDNEINKMWCFCTSETDAKFIAHALNFTYKPSLYGYKLVAHES